MTIDLQGSRTVRERTTADMPARSYNLSEMKLVGRGGTRSVYLDPRKPDDVIKIFERPPDACDLEVLLDVPEFARYLAGQITIELAVLIEKGLSRTDYVVRQPFCVQLGTTTLPISLSYWELLPRSARPASATLAANEPTEIVAAFLEIEPASAFLLNRIRSDADLQHSVSRFAQQVAAYTERTGRIVDLAGNNNVVIVQTQGEASVEAIDLVKNDRIDRYWLSVERIRSSELAEITLPLVAPLLNHHVFVRAMSVIEIASGFRWPNKPRIASDTLFLQRLASWCDALGRSG